MKCKYCGKDLAPGAMFCDGCGAKLKGDYEEAPQNNGYGAMPPKKGNTGLKVTIIILSVLLVAAIVGLVLFFVLKGDGDKKENGNDNDIVEKKDDQKDDKKDDKKVTKQDSMTCTVSDETGAYGEIVVLFDDDGEAESMSVTLTFATTDEAQEYYSYLKLANIDATLKGKTIIVEDFNTMTGDNWIGKTKSEIKNSAKSSGFTCK